MIERDCQQSSAHTPNENSAPMPGAIRMLVRAEEDVSCPKEHEDRCRAGEGSGKAKSQYRRPQKEVDQSYGIDN